MRPDNDYQSIVFRDALSFSAPRSAGILERSGFILLYICIVGHRAV